MLLVESAFESETSSKDELINLPEALEHYEQSRPSYLKSSETHLQKAARIAGIITCLPDVFNRDLTHQSWRPAADPAELHTLPEWIRAMRIAHFDWVLADFQAKSYPRQTPDQ